MKPHECLQLGWVYDSTIPPLVIHPNLPNPDTQQFLVFQRKVNRAQEGTNIICYFAVAFGACQPCESYMFLPSGYGLFKFFNLILESGKPWTALIEGGDDE